MNGVTTMKGDNGNAETEHFVMCESEQNRLAFEGIAERIPRIVLNRLTRIFSHARARLEAPPS